MKIHHINCATLCPRFSRFTGIPKRMVAHCLLIESNNGLILVDTGFGTHDVDSIERVPRDFRWGSRPSFEPEEFAVSHVKRLGFAVSDVRDIVVTHLDLDHAGGISDFPEATVHVHKRELSAAKVQRAPRGTGRYRLPQFINATFETYDATEGDAWFGFENVQELPSSQGRVLLVPLHGHTEGHCGVAAESEDGWVLHAGDAYFNKDEMKEPPSCPRGLVWFQKMLAASNDMRLANQARLRALAAGGEVRIFSAHDATEFDEMSSMA